MKHRKSICNFVHNQTGRLFSSQRQLNTMPFKSWIHTPVSLHTCMKERESSVCDTTSIYLCVRERERERERESERVDDAFTCVLVYLSAFDSVFECAYVRL